MTFREIRNEKGYMPKWVLQRLKDKGIDLSDWQFNNRETHPYKFRPSEIQALCEIYEVDISEVKF